MCPAGSHTTSNSRGSSCSPTHTTVPRRTTRMVGATRVLAFAVDARKPFGVARLNLSIPDEVHNRARAAAGYAGVTLTEWVARVMAAAADDELAKRAEEERRRRGR